MEVQVKTPAEEADAFISLLTAEQVLRLVGDGQAGLEPLEVVRALVRRYDRKQIARDNRKAHSNE